MPILARIPGAEEVRGSMMLAGQGRSARRLLPRRLRVLITKPSIAGYGLNWQHCARMAFAGLSFSYENYYQAIRRCWRFGQTRPVEVHIAMADTEAAIKRVIDRKAGDHGAMKREMAVAMRAAHNRSMRKTSYSPTGGGAAIMAEHESDSMLNHGDKFSAYHADCVEACANCRRTRRLFALLAAVLAPVHLFGQRARHGQCANDAEFLEHYGFLLRELHRVTKPGRLTPSIAPTCRAPNRCMARSACTTCLATSSKRTRSEGWTYHSRITIWKDPVVEMQRTKALGCSTSAVQG
jgi:hypothetical protein